MTKWPVKVMWNHLGRYERVRSFKKLGEAYSWVNEHPDVKMVVYIRQDLVIVK